MNDCKLLRRPFEVTGVSVITCTKRAHFMENVLANFTQQDFPRKELIIILNNDSLDVNAYRERVREYDGISVFQLPEVRTLGTCLNAAVDCARYNVVAKFDDDDYYAPRYLSRSLRAFEFTAADVIGKCATYVYFKKSRILAVRRVEMQNTYIGLVEGATLIVKKEVFQKVRFADVSLGEDLLFCENCYKAGIRVYATDKYNHVYIRYGSRHHHAWKVKDKAILACAEVIGRVDDFRSVVSSD